MIKKPTVFVIGAGASAEVNLPVGTDLLRIMDEKLDFAGSRAGSFRYGDTRIQRVMLNQGFFADRFNKECDVLQKAMVLAPSIDYVLDGHQKNKAVVDIGKLAIVCSILDAESASSLMSGPGYESQINFKNVTETWFAKLWKILIQGISVETVERIFNNVTFIVFNYDRCIEHFLFHALKGSFDLKDEAAAKVMRKLKIYHPYGKVGRLDWMEGEEVAVPYGSKNVDVGLIARELRTFTEEVERSHADVIKTAIANAQQMIYLGFAFHPQNMQLIQPSDTCRVASVFASTYGIEDDDRPAVIGKINRVVKSRPNVLLATAKCGKFFEHYAQHLSDL